MRCGRRRRAGGLATTVTAGAVLAALSGGCREAPPGGAAATPAPAPPAASAPDTGTPAPPAASAPSPTAAPPADAAAVPVPFESEGACPFECCVYRTWTVRRPATVRSERDPSAPVAFTLAVGESVEAETGVVVVGRPGRAVAREQVAIEGMGTLRPGDEVAVLHPLGEGFWLVWRDGRTGSAEVIETSSGPGMGGPQLRRTAAPEFRWWIRVRDKQGRTGWTDQPGSFGNKDACG